MKMIERLEVVCQNNFDNRPTLVFLHDSLGCIELWRDFPYQLSIQTNCNVFVYDRLGYGKSPSMDTSERTNHYLEKEADVLYDLLKHYKVKQPILVGHSDGGSIALIAASKYTAYIDAVICQAAHVFVEDITLKGISDAKDAYINTDLAKRLLKYHGDKVTTLFEAWTDTWLHPNFKHWNIEYLLPEIKCPLLFIQGDQDEYGSLLQVDKTVNQVSGYSQKAIIPGAGHSPHKEMPEQILHLMTIFINQIVH